MPKLCKILQYLIWFHENIILMIMVHFIIFLVIDSFFLIHIFNKPRIIAVFYCNGYVQHFYTNRGLVL